MSEFLGFNVPWKVYSKKLDSMYPKKKKVYRGPDHDKHVEGIHTNKASKQIKKMKQPLELKVSDIFDLDEIRNA